jgi:hypothetical protein
MEEKKSKSTAAKPTKRGRPKKKSLGVGDTIEKVTTATGIKAAVDWFAEATGVDCGCDARKEKLNKLFPYKKPECLTKEEYDFIAFASTLRIVGMVEQKQVNTIYNRVFHDRVQATNCGSCLAGRIDELMSVKSAYDEQG